jgi:hypothetical protein
MIHRYVEFARFLLLVVCLVPVSTTRQAAVACAPVFPLAPVSPVHAPASEEEDERETETEEAGSKERLADPARPRVVRESATRMPKAHAGHVSALLLRSRPPVPHDPLRNGLGTHYRC